MRFEKVSRFKDVDLTMPIRKTANSAGYDIAVAEDTVIQPYHKLFDNLSESIPEMTLTLNRLRRITKNTGAKPTLVPTGMKCYLDPNTYLELSVRSSCPLNYWLVLANGVGIIDADYVDNASNEGEIFFQMINLSPAPIRLQKGEIIGQGIIKKYEITEDDNADGQRTGGFGSTTV